MLQGLHWPCSVTSKQHDMKQRKKKTKTKKQPPEEKVHWQSTCSAWVSFFLFFAASLVASFNASFASNIARSAWQTLKYVQLAACPSFMQRNYTDACMPLQRNKKLEASSFSFPFSFAFSFAPENHSITKTGKKTANKAPSC